MKRRHFVKKAALGTAAGAALAGCGGATQQGGAPAVQTQQRVRWRLVSSFSRSLDTIFGAAEVLADRVSALTDGRFQIRPYPPGELVPAFGVLDAVQGGTVQMGHSASYYYIGKNLAFAFDTGVPFGLTSRQQTAWMYYGGGLELMRELFADFNIINFPGGNTGAQMGGWFRREVNSLDELQGIKMRIPGLGGRVMDTLGVIPQQISSGEIYPALERGAIDATEWVGPYDDEKLGFHEIARYYYYPGWWEPGPQLAFFVNRNAWDSLPSVYQEALAVAAAEAHVHMQARYDAQNPPALQRLIESGTELRRFSDGILQAASAATEEILAAEAGDALYNRIYASFRDWKATIFPWFGIAEHAYAEFAYGEGRGMGDEG